MSKFNSTKFVGSVRDLSELAPYVLNNTTSKNLIIQAAKDNGYSAKSTYHYLRSLLEEHHPDYMSKYLSYDWMKIYGHYINAGGELSNQLQQVLDMMEGKKNNGDLKDWFFSIINDLGVNPEVMEIDMSIDFFGWHRTLQLIIDIADMSSLETVSTSVETVSRPTHVGEPEAADLTTSEINGCGHVLAEKEKKTRTRTKYKEIQQCSLAGEVIRTWKSISEICRVHPEYCHSSISKCVGGSYKTAHNHVWKGIKEDDLTMAA